MQYAHVVVIWHAMWCNRVLDHIYCSCLLLSEVFDCVQLHWFISSFGCIFVFCSVDCLLVTCGKMTCQLRMKNWFKNLAFS